MNPLLFTDPAFLFFFAPIVLSWYWLIPAAWRNTFLTIASLVLYAWGEGSYAAVLLASIAINFVGGIAISRAVGPRARWYAVAAGVVLNLLLLTVFKYADFFLANFDAIIARFGIEAIQPPHLRLPIGVSFFTFMGISYLVDLYRRDLEAPSGVGRVALFQSMFPHLIAGPIVRMTELAGQFGLRNSDSARIAAGIRRFVIGLGKKMLIANTLATASDAIFQLPAQQVPASYAWLAVVCYTIQIYYDFSGYSDMAIGLAGMLGFTFPENFNYPYISQSISEFWRRWHITLSRWLRDYLFFPLGVRGGRAKLLRNQLIVFFLCGLWHGADWHFVAWGLWHGGLVGMEHLGFNKILRIVPAPVRIAYTMFAVSLGWILFRSLTLHHAFYFAESLLGYGGPLPPDWLPLQFIGPATYAAILAGIVGATPVWPAVARFRANQRIAPRWTQLMGIAEFAALAVVFASALATAAGDTYHPFIYFRF